MTASRLAPRARPARCWCRLRCKHQRNPHLGEGVEGRRRAV